MPVRFQHFLVYPRSKDPQGQVSVDARGYQRKANPIMRNYLFMCSFTASYNNPQCKALYDRIVAKGKSKKLALIAVTNKLIKQAFSIAKSGIKYSPEYRSVSLQA